MSATENAIEVGQSNHSDESTFQIRRVDQEPTPDVLLQLLKENKLGRNAELKETIEFLHNIDGPYSIFLDCPWGAGKTFFVKQLALILEILNPHLAENKQGFPSLKELEDLEQLDGYGLVPVYYNAWKNDYWNHPLPSLGAALALSVNEKFNPKSHDNSSRRIAKALETIGNGVGMFAGVPGAGTISTAVGGALSGSTILGAYRSEQTLREAVKELVDSVLHERGEKLLLIVDELDRCRPSFALEMFEATKELFNDPRVIVLYVGNESALSKMVEKEYGTGILGSAYLRRFYDYRFSLIPTSIDNYSLILGLDKDGAPFHAVTVALAEMFDMTMRDVNRFLARMEKLSQQWSKLKLPPQSVYSQVFHVVVPILHAIDIMDSTEYRTIRKEMNGSSIWQRIADSGELQEAFYWVAERRPSDLTSQNADVYGEQFCNACCHMFWNRNCESQTYQDAKKHLRQWQLFPLGNFSGIANVLP